METIDFSQPPVLRDGELTLRPHTLKDTDGVLERCLDPLSIAWTSVPLGYTREMAEDYIRHMNSGEEPVWYFALDIEGQYAGTLDVRFHLGAEDGTAAARAEFGTPAPVPTVSLGFVMHPAFRGRELMGRAVRLAVDEVFRRELVDRILWEAAAGNAGSWKSVESVGFPAYTVVPALLEERGARVDGWHSVLTREAWAAGHRAEGVSASEFPPAVKNSRPL